jgi:hypothetical protein
MDLCKLLIARGQLGVSAARFTVYPGRETSPPPHIRAVLKDHLDTHAGAEADALLFPPSRGGCHLNDKTFRHQFAPALTRIGRDGDRPRALRLFQRER